jgi:hypothetical protein
MKLNTNCSAVLVKIASKLYAELYDSCGKVNTRVAAGLENLME